MSSLFEDRIIRIYGINFSKENLNELISKKIFKELICMRRSCVTNDLLEFDPL